MSLIKPNMFRKLQLEPLKLSHLERPLLEMGGLSAVASQLSLFQKDSKHFVLIQIPSKV